jgi:uncharacterized protein YehS (DUF1456 family)
MAHYINHQKPEIVRLACINLHVEGNQNSRVSEFMYESQMDYCTFIKNFSMTNNDIMRRIRYIFDFSDAKMIELFASADLQVTRSQISDWLKKEDDPSFLSLNDHEMALFLNGLINDKRGKKEGVQPIVEKRVNNNIIFRKLKIALNLKDEDILEIMELADFQISKHELSAIFRHPSQKQYRACNDQFLRYFLMGLQVKHKGKDAD